MKKDVLSTGQPTYSGHIRHRLIFLLAGVLTVSLCAVQLFTPLRVAPKAKAESWQQIWSDEFNGGANTPVDSQWQFDTGTGSNNDGWGNNQQEYDTDSTSNVYQDGKGHLSIKAINDNGNWTSGRIETTRDDFAAPAGGELQVTASIQLPNVTGAGAQGYWPAFWLLGAGIRNGGSWPGVGEIDVMENVDGANNDNGTLHCGYSPGGPCNESNGLGSSTSCSGTTCQGGFHTYTVIVDRSSSPEEIRWYLDGNQFWSVNADQMDSDTWSNTVHHGFFILLNVAMGGYWPGYTTSATQSGKHMDVDYVRVYTSGGQGSGGSGNGPYYIQNRNSGLVLDDTGWSTSNGTKLEQWSQGNGQANQQWYLNPTGDGYYYIQNRNSGLVLDDTGWSTSNGTQIQQWSEVSGQADQEWELVSAGSGYNYIQNRYSGLVLDDTNWSTSNGTIIQQWSQVDGQADQEWKLIQA